MTKKYYTAVCQVCNKDFDALLNNSGTPRKRAYMVCSSFCYRVVTGHRRKDTQQVTSPKKGLHYSECCYCSIKHGPYPYAVSKIRQYCSLSCSANGRALRAGKKLHGSFVCEWCNKASNRKGRGGNDSRRFCSRGCAFAWLGRNKSEKDRINDKERRKAAEKRKKLAEERRAKIAQDKAIAIINSEVLSIRRIGLNVKATARVRLCCACGGKFILNGNSKVTGGGKKYCYSCGINKTKEYKRSCKQKRRALERGAAHGELIDPLKVLSAFNWKCYLCGVKTPKNLRGSYEDNAPEIDHIVPISKGGLHIESNLACCCRSCNAKKSNNDVFLI